MRARPYFLVILFGTSACSSTPSSGSSGGQGAEVRADLVLVGGAVVTMERSASHPANGATAIAIKDGKIARVGSDGEIERWIGPDTKVIGLAGRVAVPGLVDSHMHLEGLGMRRFGVDLVGTASIEEIRAKLRKAIAAAKEGEWIQGRGWDQNDWESFKKKGLKFPTAKDLDDISPKNPVVLTRIDGHAIWVNSKAMEAADVTAKTKTKDGGEIIKIKGKPSGIFIDNAIALISEKMPAPTKEQLRAALLLGQKECLSAGLTQVHNMGVGPLELEVLKELDERGELKLRVYGMLDGTIEDLGGLMGGGPLIPSDAGRRLTVRGVKFFIDGALGSRGALLLEPYSDDKKNSGVSVMQPEVLEARVRSAHALGYQVTTHAIGDRGNRVVLDIYQRVFGGDAARARPRIEHAQVIALEDIPRFGKHSVIASMQPTHATSDMPWAEKRVGKERIAGAYAWRSLMTSGATIAAGSDAPVEDISPVLGLYAAMTRMDEFGSPAGGWRPEERMTPEEALASFTRGGAFASFRENEAGVIREGFAADITVLDRDPLQVTPEELNSVQAVLTIIGGSIEYARQGADAPPIDPAKTATTSTTAAAK